MNLPVLGAVPDFKNGRLRFEGATDTFLAMRDDPEGPIAEAYRSLRTNLMFASVERPLETLLVTSSAQSEDKSVVLANLAVTFAQAGNKTIIVEADLRRPAQHELWGIANERGLTDMILQDTAMSSPPLVATDISNLSVLPSGKLPPVPSDVLSSAKMSEVIGVLRARAHYILFDAPPIGHPHLHAEAEWCQDSRPDLPEDLRKSHPVRH